MNFALTDYQRRLQTVFREFGEAEFTSEHVSQWRHDQGLPDDVMKKFVDLYFSFNEVSSLHSGLGIMSQTLILEELSRCAGAVLPFQNDLFNLRIIADFADDAVFLEVAQNYRDTGRLMFSLAVTEPQAGSDTMAMKTRVTNDAGRLVLNGQKTYVNNGEYSPSILVAALDPQDPQGEGQTAAGVPAAQAAGSANVATTSTAQAGAGAELEAEASKSHPSLSLWLIPHNLPGIRAVPIHKIGQHMVPFASVSFENVELQPEYRLQGNNGGFSHLFRLLEYGRVFVCASSLGMAQAAMEDAVASAKQRQAFGTSVGNFQQIQQMLTDMEVSLQTMRAMLYQAAWSIERDAPGKRLSVALMKRYIPKTATQVASDAMQVLGGLGYTETSRVSTIWQDCRGNQIAEGTDQIMVYIAAPLIMDKYEGTSHGNA